MTQWQLIDNVPAKPCPVLFYRGNAVWHDKDGTPVTFPTDGETYRNEHFALGFWDGKTYRDNGTGHACFEFDYNEDWWPTHWMPLPDPPSGKP